MAELMENLDKLNKAEKSALDEMKRRFSTYKEDYMKDDHFLLHWLIARKFNVDTAETMLIKHYRYRKSNNMDRQDYRTTKLNPLMEKYYPHGVFNYDKNGRPVAYFPIGGLDEKGLVTNVKTSDIYKAIMYWQEQRRWNCQDATKRSGKKIQQATYILDLKGLGTKHLWKPGLDIFQEILHIVEQHTPEIIHKLFIINGDYKDTLLDIIDRDQLPVYYGGTAGAAENDPTCSKHIFYGGMVPLEEYVKQGEYDESRLKELRIKAGSFVQVPVIVDSSEAVLEWYIKSDSTNDFFFGIFRTTTTTTTENDNTNNDDEKTNIDQMEMMVPYFRIFTFYVPETGQLKVKPGKYLFHFDNSHSWVTGKRIKYDVKIIYDEKEDKKIL